MYIFSGPFNQSSEWDGIFGNVVLGNYPISVSTYVLYYERSLVVDFAAIVKGINK